LERRRAFLEIHIYSDLEELSIAFGLETSGGGSYHPDLSFGRVWAHLEASFIRAEIVGFGIQEGAPQLEDLAFGGV
jgi:hypothetical protein